MIKTTRCVIHAILAAVTASCAAPPPEEGSRSAEAESVAEVIVEASPSEGLTGPPPEEDPFAAGGPETPRDLTVLGSGVFVQGAGGRAAAAPPAGEGVTLNFENASLPEFLRVVFDTILGENYLIDPQIDGTVTLHTTRPVSRDAVLPIVEVVLEQNGAALLRDGAVYRVVALANAAGATGPPAVGRFPSSRREGYGIQVVPLAHVSAGEIEKILGPFVPEGSTMVADPARNVLILSGPKYRVDDLLATVRTFDVDWLQGMSFAMFRLEYADAASVVSELEAVLGGSGESPLTGIVRLLPVERLNAVLAITHRPEHIRTLKPLIEQFDWGLEGSAGRRLYVYELQNGVADRIAGVLQQIFGQRIAGGSVGEPRAVQAASDVFRDAQTVTRPPPLPGMATAVERPQPPRTATTPTLPISDEGAPAESGSDVMIIADPDNNAILVMATQQDYQIIETAIRRLDVAPRQVLIEATIAEVTLSDSLAYGVRWFIEKSNYELGFNAPVPSTAAGEGLAFAFFDDSRDIRAFFDLLATEASVKFLSTPQVMVLDNQTANIRVGDQIPVTTRSSQGTSDPDAPIVSEVQYRDTGTLLTVTPRINAGGQITLEISQEVSVPGSEPAVGGGGNVAIAQRTITSSVIVHDGQTVVLGGLIRETTTDGKSGVPVLMNLPVLGYMFSSETENVSRTELIVTVRPLVVSNQRQMEQVTEELRERMAKANEYERAAKESASSR